MPTLSELAGKAAGRAAGLVRTQGWIPGATYWLLCTLPW
jgi:hypothetical protein